MDRRTFASFTSAGLLGVGLGSAAQQAGKVWRVGFLAGGPRPQDGAVPAPLRNALAGLGYVDGKDIAYEGRWGEARNERLPGFAAELVAQKVDVIVTFGGPSAAAAKQATSTIPIVVNYAGDTVETGLVASLARPGGNVTGINDPAAILSAKRLEFLKELVPAAKRIAVLWNAGDNAMTLRYREIEKAAQVLRVMKLAASYISRILKGAKPADLPVEQPNRYYFVINQTTAKALGVTIPQTLLLRADELIQ